MKANSYKAAARSASLEICSDIGNMAAVAP